MLRKTFYRLFEYKIIENDEGDLTWESHFGLGALQEGRCFKKGTILFIGPAESECAGFLKGEFLDHLDPLPDWRKTAYFCRGFEILHCGTGKGATKEEMRSWTNDRGLGDRDVSIKSGSRWNDMGERAGTEYVSFRLQRYEIIKEKDGRLSWKTYAGPNIVKCGTCIVLEDTLFMGSRATEPSNLMKRPFFANLQQLPKWSQTRYYCPTFALYDCKTGNRLHEESGRRSGENTAAKTEGADGRGKYGNRFKMKKSNLPEDAFIFRLHRFREWVIHTAGLIRLIASWFWSVLIERWKEFNGRRHGDKGDHPSGRQ